jgi:hypothetical protein
MLLAMLLQGDPPKRPPPADTTRTVPYVDPRLLRHQGLLDSLLAASGAPLHAPDSILYRQTPLNGPPNTTGFYDPKSRRLMVSPDSRDQRRTLSHEFGHVLMQADPDVYERFFREGRRQEPVYLRHPNGEIRPTDEQAERFADAFRDAFDALSRGDTTRLRPDVQALARVLGQRPPFAKSATADSALARELERQVQRRP